MTVLRGGVSLTAPEIRDKVQIFDYTNIAGWVFDAFLKISEDSRLYITEHPVQTGAVIADHCYLLPRECEFEILMTDCATSMISGQFSGAESRSISAYKVLKELQASRLPMQVTTRLNSYDNMLIESMPSEDDFRTAHGLRINVKMKEILLGEVKTVKISSRPQITDKTARGKQAAQVPKESILYRMAHGTLF